MKSKNFMTCSVVMLVGLASNDAADAVDARMARTLMKVDPDTRLEQVCDIEAMHRVGKGTSLKPDRAKSYISTPPIHSGDTMTAPGAAFRSKGKWYSLSFECTGTSDHLRVVSFAFKVGVPIPRARWADLGLWQ